MRTKEEGTAVLLTPAFAWNPVNAKPSCSPCWLCQWRLRGKSHGFGGRVSVLKALERSRGGPAEEDLDSKLLHSQAV